MLLVKTTLRQSSVHGLGVFAAEFIPAGTVVWCFQPDFDFRVSEESVAALPEIARDKMLHYSAKWGGGYVISADDARFINHSSGAANLRTLEDPDVDIAARDIQAGEELREDYREFDDTFAGRPIERGVTDTGTADDQIDPAVVDEIRRRIADVGWFRAAMHSAQAAEERVRNDNYRLRAENEQLRAQLVERCADLEQAVRLGVAHMEEAQAAKAVWKVDRTLRDFLNLIYTAVETAQNPSHRPERATPDQIKHTSEILHNLYTTVEQVYTHAKANGLTNRAILGAGFNSVKVRAEELLEIADMFDLYLDDDVDRLLSHAIEDVQAGRTYDLPVLK